MDEISFQIRNIIVQEFSRVIASRHSRCWIWPRIPLTWASWWRTTISATIAQYGLTIPELYIENISLPPAVEARWTSAPRWGLVGDLGKFTQFQAAEALARADSGAGNAMATGMGAGLGMQMAGQMATQRGPWGAAPATVAPPPPPVEKVWHVAVGGKTEGPFSRASMGRKAVDGSLTRERWSGPPGRTAGKPPMRWSSWRNCSPLCRRRRRARKSMAAPNGFSRLQIALHWLIAVLIVAAWFTHEGMGRALRTRIETGASGIEGNTLHVWFGGARFRPDPDSDRGAYETWRAGTCAGHVAENGASRDLGPSDALCADDRRHQRWARWHGTEASGTLARSTRRSRRC